MNKLNIALVRVLQFCVFALFTFMVLAYFGTLLLLPLDLIVQLSNLLSLLGMPGIMAFLVALPVALFLGYKIYQIPGLCKMITDIGVDLVTTGQERVQGFDEIVESLKNSDEETQTT